MELHLPTDYLGCDRCLRIKFFEGALINRDPRLSYCICRECRDELVKLLEEVEFNTVKEFLGKSDAVD